jgi:cytochrome c oxidase cbb3-type subunit 1
VAVILLLLIAPPSLGMIQEKGRRIIFLCWATLVLDLALFALCDKGNSSHRPWQQAALLGALLVWIPLLPLYFRAFRFPDGRTEFQTAALGWFCLLTITGWISFLPKVLDSWKFTNALVAHSHLAMAGFVSCFNIFLLNSLRGETSPVIFRRTTFRAWNVATLLYVILMWIAGTLEAMDPAFTILPNAGRTFLYSARALCGVIMLICAAVWWRTSLAPLSAPQPADEILISSPEISAIAA